MIAFEFSEQLHLEISILVCWNRHRMAFQPFTCSVCCGLSKIHISLTASDWPKELSVHNILVLNRILTHYFMEEKICAKIRALLYTFTLFQGEFLSGQYPKFRIVFCCRCRNNSKSRQSSKYLWIYQFLSFAKKFSQA